MKKIYLFALLFTVFAGLCACDKTESDEAPKNTGDYTAPSGDKIMNPSTNLWTPLMEALDDNNFDAAKKLLEKDKEPVTGSGSPLILFFADGYYNSAEVTEFLIKNGVGKAHYNAALLQSAAINNLPLVRLFLKAGADINAKNEDGKTALFLTSSSAAAQFLIDNKINAAVKDKSGKTAADYVLIPSPYKDFALFQTFAKAGLLPDALPQKTADDNLLVSAFTGNVEAVKYFLSKGANPDAKRGADLELPSRADLKKTAGQTPLMLNAIQGFKEMEYRQRVVEVSPEIAKILISAGADVNAVDSAGLNALHYAKGDFYAMLINWGPIPMGNRRMRNAGYHGDPVPPARYVHNLVIKALEEAGAKTNPQQDLQSAIEKRDLAAAKKAIQAGANCDIETLYNTFGGYDDKEQAEIDAVALILLQKGAKVKDERLFFFFNRKEAKKLFEAALKSGANPNAVHDEKTLLTYAIRYNRTGDLKDYLDIFFKYKADPDLVDGYDATPLFWAASDDDMPEKGITSFKLVQYLLDKGADINKKDEDGYNQAVRSATNRSGDIKMLEFLISKGARVKGVGALSSAAEKDRRDMMDLLIKHGVSVNDKPIDQNTPLTGAASSGNMDNFNYLLSKGAALDVKNPRLLSDALSVGWPSAAQRSRL